MRRSVVSNKVAALRIAILLALVALTISGVIVATVSATETRSLTSSADTQIVENAPTKNYGATTSLGVNENDQSSIGKDKFALVKWDLSRIAPRTQINSASVTLNVTNSSTETYQAYVLKKPWVESEATWNVYSSGEPWEVAGAKGSLDKEATVAGSITPSIKGKNTLTLPLAVVQGWVDNPDTNQGIIIAYPSSTRGFNFNSREDTDPTRRPQLILDLSPDTAPPETTIDSGPPGTISSGKASFDFSSTELGSSFECKLDSGTYESCTSPNSLTDLSDGSHTFSVKATDEAGNTDPTPADFTWTVDTTPPETTIDSGPSGTVSTSSADFSFSATEDGSTFECSLDGSAFEPCSSPQSYTDLSEGSHTFSVRTKDAAGNVDPSPAIRHYSVEVPPPDIDGDTVSDSSDNCPLDPNASQADQDAGFDNDTNSNGTTKGNVCDPDDDTPATDADGDGVLDSSDKCTGHDDAADVDGDGTPDGCDTQDNSDSDGDGVGNFEDACPDHAGPGTNSGCALLIPQENVTDYGATPNDGTDDTAEFLAAANAAGPGVETYVEAGTFHLNNLNLPSDTDLAIEADAAIKKFGTSGNPVFSMQGVANTSFKEDVHIYGVNGKFTLDLSDATQDTAGFRIRGVKNFSIENMHEIGRNDDASGDTGPNGSIFRPVLSFLPVDKTKLGGEWEHAHNGLVQNITVENQAFGWGLTQLTGAEDVHFQDITSEGGVALRLENYEANATTIDDVTADNVTCVDGNRPLMLNPHNADNGDVHITDVMSNGCWQGVKIEYDQAFPSGNFDNTTTVDRLTVLPGNDGQKNDPGGPLNSWLIGPSAHCVYREAGTPYSVQISGVNCGGLPSVNWSQ